MNVVRLPAVKRFPRTRRFFRKVGATWNLNRRSPIEKVIVKNGGRLDPITVKTDAGVESPMRFFRKAGIHTYSLQLGGNKYVFLVSRLHNKILEDTIAVESKGERRKYHSYIDPNGVEHILYAEFPAASEENKIALLKRLIVK
jgi:hypothetical protein